ncbi:MAG: hypothetical protein ACREBD_04000 [Blastocatellia bacterium]
MANRTALTKTTLDPIMGLFNDCKAAARAYQALFNYGYTRNEITVGTSDEARKLLFQPAEPEVDDKTLEGLVAGLVIGAGVGAVAGVGAGVGTSLIVPGLGLVIAGWLAAGLVGVGAGGVAGGLIGALVGSGIVEEKANEEIGQGNILIAVIPHSKAEATRIESEWLDRGSKEVIRQ